MGIGLGAQTAQWLLGEPMARTQVATSEPRLVAAALLGPYVGFEGPAMHQRYEAIVTPLLVAYGLTETDPYGLGMTSQQRRAMVLELRNARVTELRLPTSSLAGALAPGAVPGGVAGGPAGPGGAGPMSRSEPPTRGPARPGRRYAGGQGQSTGWRHDAAGWWDRRDDGNERRADGRGVGAGERAARVALLLSVQAFFEAELLGSRDARDWLEGPHPGPAQWTTYAAGRR